jgi:signal transduction histidine kinase
MYACIGRETDAAPLTCRYVDQVEPADTPLTRLTHWFREVNPWAIDAVLGTVWTVLGLVGLFGTHDPKYDFRDVDAFAVVLALGCSLPFFLRRRAPLATLAICTVSLAVLSGSQYPASVQSQMLIIFAYTLGAWEPAGAKRALGLAIVGVALVIVGAIGIPDASRANLALTGAFYAASYAIGSSMRNRRLYNEQLEQRAADLERERDEEAKRAVADERLRIAQELHDVVAHSMGVIAVQAGVGAHVIDTDPAEAKQSLEAIAATSRSTLTEIRRLLGVLRADERGAYQPAPGLADLGKLADDLGAAGVPVTLTVEGTARDVPPGVDLTAYRIVQEALTNVLKHAGPAHAQVLVDYAPGTLRLEIADDGRGVNGRASDGGHGLVGMRERVGVYGGSLSAGAAPGGGFRVVAELPYGDTE